MESKLYIYNSLSREKEVFEPINPPFVGMYVCGPTVYNEAHLGNLRTFLTFDIVYRYLISLGYKVRYVRNITDVGHLVNDADEGEDKIGKQARLEKLEPMEIVQRYTNGFHDMLKIFNLIPPSIEPTATGHIIEQIEMTQQIIENGFAYEINGSVYFDVKKFMEKHPYGQLSGRKVEDLLENTRDLDGQGEKKNSADFALWKKASPEHIMRWNSPWGEGFPGWHIECSVMSTKYLGKTFDIHGGGMDLKFPHHECEIAQNVGSTGNEPVKYWMHGNMLTVEGSKMSKSLGNSFLPHELISGNHPMLNRGYDPMVIRFFMLQSHYRSTIDFSNQALDAAEKGFQRLCNAISAIDKIDASRLGKQVIASEEAEIKQICEKMYQHLNDDFSTAEAIARLFDLSKKINSYVEGSIPVESISMVSFDLIKQTVQQVFYDILGLRLLGNAESGVLDGVMNLVLEIRKSAREQKDWSTSDLIRDQLQALNIVVKDGKDGSNWSVQ